MLRLDNVSIHAGKTALIQDVCVRIPPEEFVAIIGPNGAGKSTLLKAMAGSRQLTGLAEINGNRTHQMSAADLAIQRSVLPQTDNLSAALPVYEVIKLGLLPVAAKLSQLQQRRWVNEVADSLSLSPLLERNYQTLSGGERARVRFARLVVQLRCREVIETSPGQAARFALLDEPLAALDLKYQRQMIDNMRSLVDEKTSVVAVIHDLNWLVGHVDRVLVMVAGELVADGSPEAVLTNPDLSRWYDTSLTIQRSQTSNDLDLRTHLAVHA